MKSDLLVFGEEAKHLYEESYGSQGTVTASSLRVRKEPSMDAGQIGSMKQGSRVEILGQEGDWYQVSCGEDSAYMFAEYIQIEETTALSVAEYETQQKEKEQAVQQVSQAGASMSASDSELALLAAIIQCEAGGESHTGKVAVGAVIMNRVRSSQFPNSITEVVYQSGQFSPVASGILSSVLSQGARSDCYQAAQEALDAIAAKETAVNSFVTVVDRDKVLAQAENVQKQIEAGEYADSPLAGVPVAIKDNTVSYTHLTLPTIA